MMEKFDLALEKTARETLEPLAYDVLKNAATEAPFTGKYDEFDAVGIYVDPLTGDVLFSSKDKFNSGCGWPAFAKPIGELKEQEDYSNNRVRMEIKSATSNSHLGHVFDDGPKESGGLRYCINSAALKFIPITEMEDKGYGSYLDLLK
ncbi:MAG: peptide-methionine (R)-S-oxide reductase MsrB [Streptococcaceae bacterium]|nr:peptide-methionine (R)-S-oxide reductase MsrB [Streptococcaceae bacterium]